MLFNRKIQLPQRTYHDNVLEDKYDDFLGATHRLIETVEDVIIKKEVIALYPNGADKKTAILALEQTQHTMICAVGRYDSIRADLQRYYKEHDKNDFYKNWSEICSLKNSHTVVEEAYKNFLKK